MAKKIDIEFMAYLFGVLSVVFSFLQPLAGIVLGIISLRQVNKGKSELAKKTKKFGIIGIVIGVIFLIIGIVIGVIFFGISLAITYSSLGLVN